VTERPNFKSALKLRADFASCTQLTHAIASTPQIESRWNYWLEARFERIVTEAFPRSLSLRQFIDCSKINYVLLHLTVFFFDFVERRIFGG
jgi:hypothetical protein